MHNSKAKMDEFKDKIKDLLHKQTDVKIPLMGFTDYVLQSELKHKSVDEQDGVTSENAEDKNNAQKTNSEIIESIECVYFQPDFDVHHYELKKILADGLDLKVIKSREKTLKTQHNELSKQVMENILKQRSACHLQASTIQNIEKELEESLWTCRKARSYLSYARLNLTTASLQILASYRKREVLHELLRILLAIRDLKLIDVHFQKSLAERDSLNAINLMLKCKESTSAFTQYNCVKSLGKKFEETLPLLEFQLETVLNEMVLNYDAYKYGKLQEAYKLLNKSLEAMDQLHINYISAIHSSVNAVLRGYIEPNDDENVKYLYEQLCELVMPDKYVACLVSLCKTFWTILSSYYQIAMWHSTCALYPQDNTDSIDAYINEKLKKGRSRIWNDILTKTCIFIQSKQFVMLRHDQFIQVISVMQRLKRVGFEFCTEQSQKLVETIQTRCEEYFENYHTSCLEEICLFLDNESWNTVDSFSNILQLSEFHSVRQALRRHKSMTTPSPTTANANTNSNTTATSSSNTTNTTATANGNSQNEELTSVHSNDGVSSIYGSYGYFLRFSEKSSPFDGGLDETMIQEDILAGVVDEASCYFSGDSDDEIKSTQSKSDDGNDRSQLMVNNTTLNIFRYIGRYLQLCKLLTNTSPKIVRCIFELIDFYVYAIHYIFCKDSVVQLNNFQTPQLELKFSEIETTILSKIKTWPINFSTFINNELTQASTLYGLTQRIVAVESGNCLLQQLALLQNYLNNLLPINERSIVANYFEYVGFMHDLARMVYTCVTSRMIDLQDILNQMTKIKWDLNNVSFQYSGYIDIMNRNIQSFAMSLEDAAKYTIIPATQIWNSMAHVATHLLVEGFSNVKKCSAAGRALMQLDFTNFMSFLELVCKQKFPEHRAYVDGYIKAYYLVPEQLENWLEEQTKYNQYSTKQLITLVQCACTNDKRTRRRLLKLLNLLESNNVNVSLNVSTSSNSTNAET